MVISLIQVLSNLIMNYILIYGHFGFLELGIAGAAIATLLARVIGYSIYIIFLLLKQNKCL